MKNDYLSRYIPMEECHHPKKETEEAFNKLMGYPIETIEALAKQLQEINRNRIIELNQRDLKEHGIEKD